MWLKFISNQNITIITSKKLEENFYEREEPNVNRTSIYEVIEPRVIEPLSKIQHLSIHRQDIHFH